MGCRWVAEQLADTGKGAICQSGEQKDISCSISWASTKIKLSSVITDLGYLTRTNALPNADFKNKHMTDIVQVILLFFIYDV